MVRGGECPYASRHLPAPVLGRLTLLLDRIPDRAAIPPIRPGLPTTSSLPSPRLSPITLGEYGTGTSTLIEAVAALAGYDEAGRGQGYRPVDHSTALAGGGGPLAAPLRAAWLPRVTDGWFFPAEPLFSVASYLDDDAREVHVTDPTSCSGATLIEVTRRGWLKVDLRQTTHFRRYSDFIADPEGFLCDVLDGRS